MPLRDMEAVGAQRARYQIGRIRTGHKVDTGKTFDAGPRKGEPKLAPAKLTEFRFTTHSEAVVREVARLYGGDPRPWAAYPGQWEVYTTTARLDVMISCATLSSAAAGIG